jgi:hypothetical protein
MVMVEDESGVFDAERDSDLCWSGSYRYDSDFWRVETEDAPCW